MEITLEEIQKKFESLPEDLKWAIMGAKVDDNIIEIGQAENLNVEQMGQLSLETYMEMFGFTHPDKFEESVRNSLKLGDEKTKKIVTAINEKILKEIRVNIKGAPEAEDDKDSEAQILNSAGIQIIPARNAESTADAGGEKETLPVPGKLELTTIPASNVAPAVADREVHPILAQKLSGSFQIPVVETEHSLDNITKKTTSENVKTRMPNTDPYREVPE